MNCLLSSEGKTDNPCPCPILSPQLLLVHVYYTLVLVEITDDEGSGEALSPWWGVALS